MVSVCDLLDIAILGLCSHYYMIGHTMLHIPLGSLGSSKIRSGLSQFGVGFGGWGCRCTCDPRTGPSFIYFLLWEFCLLKKFPLTQHTKLLDN